MENKDHDTWHLIALHVSLNGHSFKKILNILENDFNYKYITINDFEGSGRYGLFYDTREVSFTGKVFSFNEIYAILEEVTFFDWVDFFLFQEYPDDWRFPEDYDYIPLIADSDGLVRGVDSGYIYVYTPREDVIETVKKNYTAEQIDIIETKELKDFYVPY